MSDPTRVLLVLDHPAQHFSAAFRRLAASETVDASVLYWSQDVAGRFDEEFDLHVTWETDLLSEYSSHAPKGSSLRRTFGVARAFRRARPQMVVCYGWGTWIAQVTILLCVVSRVPLVFYGDSTWQHSGRPALRVVRNLVLRALFRLASGAVSTGTYNHEFYIWLGMHPRNVVPGVIPVDVDHYRAAYDARSRPLGGELFVGYAGKLTARKGVDELLQALAVLSSVEWRALVIGDGPERGALERLGAELGIADRVSFLGFHNTSEMPGLLASCDVVVVPSRWDLRVLVTTEAMAAGAVVIVSSETAVWGVGDLVEHGVSGFVYRSGDPDDLARCIRLLSDDRSLLAKVREEGRRRTATHGAAEFAKSIEAAAERFAKR